MGGRNVPPQTNPRQVCSGICCALLCLRDVGVLYPQATAYEAYSVTWSPLLGLLNVEEWTAPR